MTDVSPQFDQSTLERVFPYVVSREWIDATDPQHLVSEPFSDDVHMVLVVDNFGSVRNVRPEDLEAVNLPFEGAFEKAASNLARAWNAKHFEFGIAQLVDGTSIGGARGNWMAPAGGLVLGNLYQSMVEHFGQTEFAAVAVNQGFLVAFPADEATLASPSLRQLLDDGTREGTKPISRSWLLLDGNWPTDWPYEQPF